MSNEIIKSNEEEPKTLPQKKNKKKNKSTGKLRLKMSEKNQNRFSNLSDDIDLIEKRSCYWDTYLVRIKELTKDVKDESLKIKNVIADLKYKTEDIGKYIKVLTLVVGANFFALIAILFYLVSIYSQLSGK